MSTNHPNWLVITTISAPNDAVHQFIEQLSPAWSLVVVGDNKTPDAAWENAGVHYLSLQKQHELFGDFAETAPRNHYSRKNFGYLYAIMNGAQCILETDDDNYPYPDFGKQQSAMLHGRLAGGGDWVNVYRHFTAEHIWPRGLPLDALTRTGTINPLDKPSNCPIQQFLVDCDPDVDAIYRLVFPTAAVTFEQGHAPVIMDKHTWVPFNSQNTVFFHQALPLLYLPHFVTFRMTDIWRSFVAQCALWPFDAHIAFHSSTAKQLRNEHNLIQDFEQEVPGYLDNRNIAEHLSKHMNTLSSKPETDLLHMAEGLWHSMIDAGYIDEQERPLITHWFNWCRKLHNSS